jgi:hypothetical protein
MRTVRVEDVVVPVGLEERTVSIEVAKIGSNPIRAVQNREEIRNQIDEHQQPGRGWRRESDGARR